MIPNTDTHFVLSISYRSTSWKKKDSEVDYLDKKDPIFLGGKSRLIQEDYTKRGVKVDQTFQPIAYPFLFLFFFSSFAKLLPRCSSITDSVSGLESKFIGQPP